MARDTANPASASARTGSGIDCFAGSLPDSPKFTARQDQNSNPRAVREVRLELLREAIGEQAGFIQIQGELVQTFAAIGDDAGITYALKRLVAHVRAAAQTANELTAFKMEAGQ
jgi:hypothetical protein